MPPIRKSGVMVKPPPPNSEEALALSTSFQISFGKSVRDERLSHGWSQGELSKRCGIASEEISRIENGQINLTIRTMSRLAMVLDGNVAATLRKLSGHVKPEE